MGIARKCRDKNVVFAKFLSFKFIIQFSHFLKEVVIIIKFYHIITIDNILNSSLFFFLNKYANMDRNGPSESKWIKLNLNGPNRPNWTEWTILLN